MRMPANEGPTSRARFTIDEFSAIAFGRSLRSSIICTSSDCRTGMSNALISPCATARIIKCSIVITFMIVSTASAADCSAAAICVITGARCLFPPVRGTRAKGAEIRKVGINPAKLASRRIVAESLRRYASQLVATRVSQVPISETLCP